MAYTPESTSADEPLAAQVPHRRGPHGHRARVLSPTSRWAVAAGTGLGLLAALAYAGIAIVIDRELAALALLIGVAIAFGFHRFGRTRGIVPGIIAGVIALVLFFVAIFVEGRRHDRQDCTTCSFVDGMRLVTENAGDFVSVYF